MSVDTTGAFGIPNRYKHYVLPASLLSLWMMYASVMIGMALGFTDWFISKTALNQFVCCILLVLNFPIQSRQVAVCFAACFCFGFGAELLGVNTGLLFGDYHYLNNFGPTMGGVPWLIGTNWALLAFVTYGVCSRLQVSAAFRMLAASGLMVLLDVLMEPVAPEFGFWVFAGNTVPLWNYVCWFLVALPMHALLVGLSPRPNAVFCAHLLAANFIFFLWSNVLH